MKAVMLSIQPKWCELIASGKKTVEVRKTIPKLETPFKVYIYCTKGKEILAVSRYSDKSVFLWDKSDVDNYNSDMIRNGKVIGEFVCDEIEILRRNTIFNAPALYSQACLTREEYFNYIGNKTAYIWHISDLEIYDEPKKLSEFYNYKKYDWWDYGHHTNKPQWGLRSLSRPPQSWCYVEELR